MDEHNASVTEEDIFYDCQEGSRDNNDPPPPPGCTVITNSRDGESKKENDSDDGESSSDLRNQELKDSEKSSEKNVDNHDHHPESKVLTDSRNGDSRNGGDAVDGDSSSDSKNQESKYSGKSDDEVQDHTGEEESPRDEDSKDEEDAVDRESSSDSDEELNEIEIEERKKEAARLKEEGNNMFKNNMLNEAKDIYTEGLKICPKCLKKERSVLYSNRSACLMKLKNTEEAIKDCTKAVSLHPTYLKALLRRAQLQEELEKYDEALKDYEAVLEMDPSIHTARAACMRLPDKIKERNEKLKAEMMSKLKDLGNTFLRPFGLSTDNFQLQQDQNSGSYNIQFNNNQQQQ